MPSAAAKLCRLVHGGASRPEPVDLLNADHVGLVRAHHFDRGRQVEVAVGERRLARDARRLRAGGVGLGTPERLRPGPEGNARMLDMHTDPE
jgi:hypothetical protein